jgi:hypothetical protein
MPALSIVRAKEVRDDGAIVEIVVWRLAEPLHPCTHLYELGKGDHRHLNGAELPYRFVSLVRLLDDFQRDVETWSKP